MRFLNRKVTDSDKKANKIEDKKIINTCLRQQRSLSILAGVIREPLTKFQVLFMMKINQKLSALCSSGSNLHSQQPLA